VLNDVVKRFSTDRKLMETRGSLIIRKLCVLLDAKEIYVTLADVLLKLDPANGLNHEFASLMVQTLNLILLTAPELLVLRVELKNSFQPGAGSEERAGFKRLFETWCHSPVSTFSLCLLAQAYGLSSCLISKFAAVDITVGFLMQVPVGGAVGEHANMA
jgi:vacuole morphology and inheritance protein 14